MRKFKTLSKTTFLAIFLIAIAALPLITSGSTVNSTSNQAQSSDSSTVALGNASLEKHKITPNELAELKSTVGISNETENYTQAANGHGTGLRAPTEAEWNDVAQNAYFVDKIEAYTSPPSIDWSATQYFPPIGNQGSQGSCVAFAVGYYLKTFQEAKEHGWDFSGATWSGGSPTASYQNKVISPAFIYNLANRGIDGGLTLDSALNLIGTIGACSWEKMPYNQLDYTTWPSEAAWAEAPYYRGNSSYLYMDNSTSPLIDDLKNLLSSGNLAVIAVDSKKFYTNLINNSDVLTLDNYANLTPDHANTIVGYDDNFKYNESGTEKQGAFKIANSWGKGGSWEKYPDGFYYMSYQAMVQRVQWCCSCIDYVNYQPTLMAKFRIDHLSRGECEVYVGMGTTAAFIQRKLFDVSGGNHPFCPNNIVLDITEFTIQRPVFFNQPFYLRVYDAGSNTTGSISYFAIENSAAPNLPLQTKQYQYVYANTTYSSISTSFTLTPTAGSPSSPINFSGSGFTAYNYANIAYLNPATANWTTIASSVPVSANYNFTCTLNAPDLKLANAAGDNPAASGSIVFRAQDNSTGTFCNASTAYAQMRRGLTRVGYAAATGLFGNNTNLNSSVYLQVGESFVVLGSYFNPGNASFLCDNAFNVGSALVDSSGSFSAILTLSALVSAGQHNITMNDGNTNFTFTLTRLPIVSAAYDGLWKTSNFNINLNSDSNDVSNIYYRLNGQLTQTVKDNGQPAITVEGSNNTLEYWANCTYGNSTVELAHKTLSGIKLDKTPPQGTLQINAGAANTTLQNVTLNLAATDSFSGVKQVRFSNDGVWTNETWGTLTSSTSWLLSDGFGNKTVYCQIQDYAGLTMNVNSTILFVDPAPVVTPTPPEPSNVSVIPEYSGFNVAVLVMLAAATLLTATVTRKNLKKKSS